ncbi:MFS transporter [Schaalia meyeri]|uniref:MFS transporter n=1 Tax=Schaalia meyeri TaxID=52773 RepID=UPI003EB7796C
MRSLVRWHDVRPLGTPSQHHAPRDPVLLRGDWQRHLPQRVGDVHLPRAPRLRRRRRLGHCSRLPGRNGPQAHPRRYRRGRPAHDRDRSAPDFLDQRAHRHDARRTGVDRHRRPLGPTSRRVHQPRDLVRYPGPRGGTLSTAEYHEFLAQLSVVTGNGDTWRYMIVLCSIPAIALWIGIRLMPESSRWYVAKDRLYEAIGALKRVRNEAVDGLLVEELADIATIHRAETSSERKGFGYVWRTPWLRKLMIVDIFPGTTNQLTGVNTVMYYAFKVLQYAGMDTSSAIVAQVANGVMSVVGSALGIWLILNFRRRQILIADVIGVGLSLLTIAAVFQFAIAPYMNAQQTPPAWAAYAVLGLMAMFMLIVQPSNGTIVWTMMGELFPNNVRGVMNGTAIFCLWIVNAIVGWTFPVMIEGLGGGLTYTIYGIANLVVAVVLFRVMPETSGKSLEEIETEMEKRFS